MVLFKTARGLFEKRAGSWSPDAKALPPDAEGAAQVVCDLAEVLLRLGSPTRKPPRPRLSSCRHGGTYRGSKQRDLGRYLSRFCQFHAQRFPRRREDLEHVGPLYRSRVSAPTHAICCARLYNLRANGQRQFYHYDGLLNDFARDKKAGSGSVKDNPMCTAKDPLLKIRVDNLVKDPAAGP